MSRVCIIGLPVQIRKRVEGTANRGGLDVVSVLSEVAREGSLRLVPHPDQAVHRVRAYFDELDDFSDGLVIALPYTDIPQDLDGELGTFEELGGKVLRPTMGLAEWPKQRRGKLDQAFLDCLFHAIRTLLPGTDPGLVLPSAHFRNIAEQNSRFIIPDGALDECDQVALHRHDFLRKAADIFDLFLKEGAKGRIDAFFAVHGLDHAQSGGINASFTLHHGTECVYRETTSTHLKQGDKTTRMAAARIYYHSFFYCDQPYIAVLYAGPHPEANVSRVYYL